MTNRDQKKPNCPKCGKYTAARGRIKRRACEPFCTVRCAAAYGRSQFWYDPYRIWDVQSRAWVDDWDATKYLFFKEGVWWRREPKRWHSEEKQ